MRRPTICEPLEARELLAVFLVTNTNNSGAGSLRTAISQANGAAGADVIQFDAVVTGTITLTSQLTITSELDIQGPGADVLAVNGNNVTRVFNVSAAANAAIRGLTLTNGRTNTGAGVTNAGILTISDCAIVNNVATAFAGGVFNDQVGTMTILNTLIAGNNGTSFSGAMDARGTVTIRNSTISGNVAATVGGILVGGIGAATFVISNSTVVNNTSTASSAGGIDVFNGTAQLVSCIVAGNTLNGAPADIYATLGADSTNNLVGDVNSAGGLTNSTGGNIVGVDPRLAPLADNGGTAHTHALLVGSPATTNGSNPFGLETDQRGTGYVRTLDGTVDIGAFQRQSATYVVDTTSDVDDGDYGDGNLALREAVRIANTEPGPGTVSFAPGISGQTITLAGTQLGITSDLTIAGPGADRLTISGGGLSRIFDVSDGNLATSEVVSISGLTLRDGSAIGGYGGAIVTNFAANAFVSACVITSNVSNQAGGGIGVRGGSFLTISDSTLSGNQSAADGGGIFVLLSTLVVSNCTFSGNSAGSWGGGIGCFTNQPTSVSVRNSTITGNTADSDNNGSGVGGGVHPRWGTWTIVSSIIADNYNSTTSTRDDALEGTLNNATSTNNIVSDAASAGGLTNGVNGNLVGVDPLLAAIADNGGSTLTRALLPGSPAINAGLNPLGLAGDQRGGAWRRAFGSATDIGAYEVQSLVVDEGTDVVDGDYSVNHLSLREALNIANTVSGADTIEFAPSLNGSTITLGGTRLDITTDLDIDGPGAALLAISGNDISRVFNVSSGATVSMSGLTIRDGQHGEEGGGIFNAGTLTLLSSAISSCSSVGAGGGIYSDGTLILVSSIVAGNTSGSGAGIQSYGTLTITNSTIADNVSEQYYGGIWAGAGVITITGSTISGNSATTNNGGGIGADEGAALTVVNSTISGNYSGGSSGGIFSHAPITLLNCTIVNNSAESYQGVHASFTLPSLIVSTIIAGPSEDAFHGNLGAGSTNNIIYYTFPLVGPLTDNGGPTKTHAPLPSSPAIDAGLNPLGLTGDQRGGVWQRSFGSGTDIGAYEVQSLIVDEGTDVVDGDYSVNHLSLREAVNITNATSSADSITFAPSLNGSTIMLAGTEISITSDLDIQGPGAGLLTLSANNESRVLNIGTGVTASVSGLTITDGVEVGGGGAISNAGTLTLVGCTVSSSSSVEGGGGIYSEGTLTLVSSTVAGNTSSSGAGIRSSGTLTITNSTIADNVSEQYYAGIWATAGVITITGSTISGNSATTNNGGGIGVEEGAALTVVNSTISGNYSGRNSGGIFSYAPITLLNCTIFNNPSVFAPGVLASYSLPSLIVSTIIAGPAEDFFYGNLGAGSMNNIIYYTFPLVGPLSDNGGPTKTHAPLPSSPANNAGLNPLGLTSDQRGGAWLRSFGSGTDIGAYEVQPLIVDEGTDVVDGDYSVNHLSLREALNIANTVSGADTIEFAPSLNGSTITLGGTRLDITSDLTIAGLGADRLTISGNDISRVFSVSSGATVSMSGLTISDGQHGEVGGGIFNAGTLTLLSSAISSCSSVGAGGGIYSDGTLTLVSSIVSGNTSGSGAGIRSSGTLTITNSTITDNVSEVYYAGIWVTAGVTTITGSTISGNSATTNNGGGIGVEENAALTVVNSTISGNYSGRNSGGIFSYVPITLLNCTIFNNPSVFAPGVLASYSLPSLIVSTIIAGPSEDFFYGNLDAGSSNNIIFYTFPLVGPLADNGGPTKTHAPLPSSPAINAGANPLGLTGDQRGGVWQRSFGSGTDIGAYEVQSLIVDEGTDVVDGDYSVNHLSLREAVNITNATSSADSITFAPALSGSTITLAGTEISITSDLDIQGPGAGLLSLSGGNVSRVLNIASGVTASVRNITISAGGINNSGVVTVTNAELSATSFPFFVYQGGGAENSGAMSIINSTVSGNNAWYGAGLYSSGSLTIIGSTISGNLLIGNGSGGGGGILSGGQLTITNSTISGNRSNFAGGGGIGAYGPTVIRNSTIVSNYPNGLSAGASTTLVSSIVAGNEFGDVWASLGADSTNNLVQAAESAGGLVNGVNGNIVGVDPRLSPLAYNGGTTKTHALRKNSPAIDGGSNPLALTTDQRGGNFERVTGIAADIGAFELLQRAAPPQLPRPGDRPDDRDDPREGVLLYHDVSDEEERLYVWVHEVEGVRREA